MTPIKIYYVILSAVLIAILSTSCTRAPETNVAENGRFMNLLKLFPAAAKDFGGVVLIDYEKALQKYDISLTTSDGKNIALDAFSKIFEDRYAIGQDYELLCMQLGTYYTGHGINMFQSSVNNENVGYNFADVKAEIYSFAVFFLINDFFSTTSFSKNRMVSAIGQFDSNITEQSLDNDSEWPDWAKANFTKQRYQDVSIFGWGNGNQQHIKDRRLPPNLDELGRASPFAISEGHLLLADSTDDVESMISSSLGKTPSLANVPEYALAAQCLDSLNTSMAIIVDQSLVNVSIVKNKDDNSQLLKPFITCGTGFGSDKKGDYIALVLVHDNTSNAEENLTLLGQRVKTSMLPEGHPISISSANWAAGNNLITDVDIYVTGKTLVAKLYTQEKYLWYNWFVFHSNLLLHE